MARNKSQKPLTEAPPEPESSSDQQLSGSSTETTTENADEQEESSSSDEGDQNQPPSTPPPPSAPPSKKPTTVSITLKKPTPQSSSSDENTDSDDEPDLPVSKLKPSNTSKPRSKPTVAALPAEKRPAENTPEKDSSKRARKEKPTTGGPGVGLVVGPGEEGSKKLFQRVFSEDDEIALLKGLIEFEQRKGGDPMKNDDEFYNFIRKLLHVEVNKVQIVDKVRRLKKKFYNAKKNNKKIINEHEKKMFELSKKIWDVVNKEDDNGNDKVKVNNDNVGSKSKASVVKHSNDSDNGVVVSVVGADKKAKKEEDEGGKGAVKKVVEVDDEMGDFKVGEGEAKEEMRVEGLRRIGAKGRAEIREMWRKVANAQLEVDLMRNEARVEENKRILEALKR